MTVTDRKTVDEFQHEIIQLIIRQSEMFLNRLQHYVNDELECMTKGNIGQFIDHEKEELTDCSVITTVSLLQRKQHISDEDKGNVSGQRVIRQAVAFGTQIQDGFTGLEEDLDIPTLTVNPQNLFLRQISVGADESNPFLFSGFMANTYDFRWK